MKKISAKQQILRGALLLTVTGFLGAANAADFTVDQVFDGADANPGDGVCATTGGNCTLRAAVMETNALMGADTITIPAGTYSLILGNTGENLAAEGDLDILDDLTINGADPATTTVNGNSFAFRVFSILKRADNSLPVVAISNLTLTQGASDTGNGALIYNVGELTLDNITLTNASPDSRAMVNEGNFTLKNSRVTGNTFGIYSSGGKAIISDSLFSNNISTGYDYDGGPALRLGGGISNISNTTFSANEATGYGLGGAIRSSTAASLNIDGCQFIDNKAARGGAIYHQASGGGQALGIFDSIFSNNIASDSGGGIYVSGNSSEFRMKQVAMSGNQATSGSGGAIYSSTISTGSFWFSENNITNNTAGNNGGGIFLSRGTSLGIVLDYSEISGNTAAYGGGIYTEASGITLMNLTITGNTATTDGGGLYQKAGNSNTSELIHVTLADNTAPAGMADNIANGTGIVRLKNSLISAPAGSVNCNGSITTLGYNLSSDASCGLGVEGDQSDTDPLLSALADNGGFTKTIALQAGSPAINAGSTLLCSSLNPLDQRYFYRGDAACDIGAYEVGSARAQSGTLAFSAADFSVNETDGTATVTFNRTGGSEGNVGIQVYNTGQGTTASIYSDYDAIPLTWIQWANGDSNDKTLSITINDDTSFEGDETIRLQFKDSVFAYGGASLGTSVATVTIIDNDVPGEVQFSSTSYTVAENGSYVGIDVERINGNTAVAIDYATSDGTAVADTDYTPTSGVLDFAIGETSKSFFVNVTDNSLSDGDKTVNLTLSNPQDGLTLGIPSAAVITIVDDESGGGGTGSAGELQIERGIVVNETDGTATVTVTRINGSTGSVSVDYVTSTDTGFPAAENGSDYSLAAAGTLTFTDGITSQTITFSIIDDAEVEGDEGFWITLENPTDGATLDSEDWYTFVTITDDDTTTGTNPGVIAMEAPLYQSSENSSTMTYALTRTGGTGGVVSVVVTFEDGSAVFGTDYNASSQSFTVTFQDGESRVTGTISIIDDAIVELEESFIIRISNPQGGATLGSVDGAAVAITDNDNSGGSGGGGNSGGNSGGGGGSMNPLLLLGGLLLAPVIRRRKQH